MVAKLGLLLLFKSNGWTSFQICKREKHFPQGPTFFKLIKQSGFICTHIATKAWNLSVCKLMRSVWREVFAESYIITRIPGDTPKSTPISPHSSHMSLLDLRRKPKASCPVLNPQGFTKIQVPRATPKIQPTFNHSYWQND